MLDIVQLVQDLDLTGSKTKEQRDAEKASARQMQQVRKLFEGFSSDLERDDSRTYVIDIGEPPDHKAVLSLFPEYLRDKSGVEIRQGEFTVLAKVVRATMNGDAIDLIPPGSGLSGVTDEIINSLVAVLDKMAEGGFRLPKVVTKVEPPVIQLLPISVFV